MDEVPTTVLVAPHSSKSLNPDIVSIINLLMEANTRKPQTGYSNFSETGHKIPKFPHIRYNVFDVEDWSCSAAVDRVKTVSYFIGVPSGMHIGVNLRKEL